MAVSAVPRAVFSREFVSTLQRCKVPTYLCVAVVIGATYL